MSESDQIIAPTEAPLTHLRGGEKRRLRLDLRIVALVSAILLTVLIALYWQPQVTIQPQNQSFTPASAPPQTNDNAPPPFQATQRALARERAQEALSEFVEKQIRLENEMQVDNWGAEQLTQALDAAKQGDAMFVLEDFETSLAAYNQAVILINAVINLGERIFDEHLSATYEALAALDYESGLRAITSALAIKPSNAEAIELQRRVALVPEILTLLRHAKNHELSKRFNEAMTQYEQVRQLDPLTQNLHELIASARAGQSGNNLEIFISRGFAHLAEENFQAARDDFNAALSLRPGNSIATGGLQQVAEQHDLAIIRDRGIAAEAALSNERWEEALAEYNAILNLDGNIQFAKDGAVTAKAHKRVQSLLKTISEEPQKLSSQSLYLEAQEIVAEAEQLEHPGRTLKHLISEVLKLLQMYRDPVDVTLVSDNATDIIVSNVGRIGRFERHVLNLRPGQYTIRGSQSGCKDIYLSIEVLPGIEPIDLSCPQRLSPR